MFSVTEGRLSVSADPQIAALRVPPHSIEAEQAVLGGLLLDNHAFDRIADLLREDDFYRHDHRLVWRQISRLIERSQPADVVTVFESLQTAAKADEAGGLVYLNALAQETPSAANIRRYAEIVRDRAILRRLISTSDEISTTALNPQGKDTRQLLDEAESKIFQISEEGARGQAGFVPLPDLLGRVVERIDELYNQNNPNDVTGVPTGFSDLDRMTSGLQPGDLVIVAGRPSMGKTALALNIGEHVAVDQGLPVAVFSMEMGATQLAMRMVCSVGRLDQQRLRTGRLHDDDWPRLTNAIQKMQDAQMFIDETPALNALELRARARRLSRQCGRLGLIIIDYLQLMSGSSSGENRATEISEISRGLKSLAKELDCPVIALSQLNRSLEQRPNKRPVMSDLRECVTGDTLVVLADGRRVPIAQLVGSEPEVLAMDGSQQIVPARSDRIWSVGPRPVLRVSLAGGRVLRATAGHRLFTGAGWKALRQAAIGDRVALARRLPEPSQVAPSRKTLADYEERLDHDSSHAWANSGLVWDRIVAIEPDGEEEVFDLSVPGPASWLADGIVSHNSGAIEQDADVILFIYRDEVYNPDSTDKGTAEIIIGKQRNGPIGSVRLTFVGHYTKFENFAAGSG